MLCVIFLTSYLPLRHHLDVCLLTGLCPTPPPPDRPQRAQPCLGGRWQVHGGGGGWQPSQRAGGGQTGRRVTWHKAGTLASSTLNRSCDVLRGSAAGGDRQGSPCTWPSLVEPMGPVALPRPRGGPPSAAPDVRQAPFPGFGRFWLTDLVDILGAWRQDPRAGHGYPPALARRRVGVSSLRRPSPGAPLLGVWADRRGPRRRGPVSILRLNSLLEGSGRVCGTDARGPELPGSRSLPRVSPSSRPEGQGSSLLPSSKTSVRV